MPRRRERKEENRRQNGTYIIYTVTVGRRVCRPPTPFLFARNRSFVCTAGLPLVLGLRQRAATPRLYPRFPSVPGRRQGWRPPLNVHNRCNHWHCLSLQTYRQPSTFFPPVVGKDQREVGDGLIVLCVHCSSCIRCAMELLFFFFFFFLSVQNLFNLDLCFFSHPFITGATSNCLPLQTAFHFLLSCAGKEPERGR